jgi:serine protease
MLERSVGAARISHARRAVFMHPLRTPSTFTIPVVLALSLGACRGSEEAPLVSVTVDPSLSPRVESLPGFDDGQPRPLAVATDIDGEPAVFVANELWVSTDDAEGLEALLARWGGEVIASLEPGAFDLSFLPTQHLIRVDASAADVALLGEHIREIDADVTGDYTVSSDEGLALLAAAAEEAASGHALGVNWVGEGAQFLDRNVTEGPEGPSGYQPNPFEWPSHSIDASQETGVAEAWRALDFADRLGERVGVAILDMGFSPDIDTPGDMVAISNVPGVNPIDRDNILHCGDPCPWHGTNVRSAAMAVPDNGFGSAGPAGPVARPILVFTLYDFFTSITALAEAKALGADIANMSYGAPVPDFVAWSAGPFNTATAAFRASGMLLFAAAGNKGRDVNRERCFGAFGVRVCWERRFHTPCQNAGVICVGGLQHDSLGRHPDSNFGASVDIFASYVHWIGRDPETPAGEEEHVQAKNGTSFSSPFVSGIAALIWAADPSASANDVERHLFNAARPSPLVEVSRYVDAYGAVLAALGNVPPSVTITNPDPGGQVQLNRNAGLRADTVDVEDGEDCCVVHWSSDVDGFLGTTGGPAHNLTHSFDTEGTRTVTAEVVDSGGATGLDTIVIEVVNTPPSVEILRPDPGEEVPRGVDVLLRGVSTDPNEPGFSLDCGLMTWTSNVSADPLPVTGCDVLVAFPEDGLRVITLTGTDPQGESGSDSVSIEVVPPPGVIPPTVQIVEPEAGAFPFGPNQEMDFVGMASDPGGATDLDFEWYVNYDLPSGSGRELIGSTPTFSWTATDTFPDHDYCDGGAQFTIELEVTNPDGATGVDSVVIDVFVVC